MIGLVIAVSPSNGDQSQRWIILSGEDYLLIASSNLSAEEFSEVAQSFEAFYF